MSFNRTFMELKSMTSCESFHLQDGFNRTFMELKYGCADENRRMDVGFNRTFMELKFVITIRQGVGTFVLIVPLWN